MGLFSGLKAQAEKRKEYNKYARATAEYRLGMEKAEAQERLNVAKAKNEVREINREATREKFKPILSAVSNIQGRLKERKAKEYKRGSMQDTNPWHNTKLGNDNNPFHNASLGREKNNPWQIITKATPRAKPQKKKSITITINK